MNWRADFAQLSPLFAPLQDLAEPFHRCSQFPNLEQLQTVFEQRHGNVQSLGGAPLRFVPQAKKPTDFEYGYEQRIYRNGDIQTRLNWHDFFNALIWMAMPESKRALNALHYHDMERCHAQGKQNRSPTQNAVTLFDECGLVLVSDSEDLLNLVKTMRWHELFWQNRADVNHHMRGFLFGHGLYEKAFQPYPGFCANALLILYREPDIGMDTARWDTVTLRAINATRWQDGPSVLAPFPLLGMPGWYAENEHAAFYQNRSYFRAARRRENVSWVRVP